MIMKINWTYIACLSPVSYTHLLSASDFISHRFKIEQINEALEAVKRNEVIKTVLTF